MFHGGENEAWSGGDEYDYENQDVDENDSWAVISSFFDEKGLVRMQLDSFNDFVNANLQGACRAILLCKPCCSSFVKLVMDVPLV